MVAPARRASVPSASSEVRIAVVRQFGQSLYPHGSKKFRHLFVAPQMEVLRLSLSGVQLSRPYSGRCSRKNRGPPDASLVTVFRPPRMTGVLVTGSQRLVAENPVRNWSENSTGEAGHEITTSSRFGVSPIRSVRDASETTAVATAAVLSPGFRSGSTELTVAVLINTASFGARTVIEAVSPVLFVIIPR